MDPAPNEPAPPVDPTQWVTGKVTRPTPEVTPAPGQDAWSVAWRQFRRNRLAMTASAVVLLLFGLACFAPLLANGRPLYLRGHLTHLYETDVAAFEDWHARLGAVSRELRQGAAGEEREELLQRAELYRDGLPGILERLAGSLPPDRQRQLEEVRRRYRQALATPPEQLDLALHEQLGEEVATIAGALSLGAAYKQAAAPLLRLPDLVEAWSEARAGGDAAAREALLERARTLARRTRETVPQVARFLPAEEQAALSARAVALIELLERLEAQEDPAQARLRGEELEQALDRAASLRVDPLTQVLPMETRWPAFAYLSAGEVGFLVLYLTVLAALAARRAVADLSPAGRVALLLAPALAAGVLWRAFVPDVHPPAESLYKRLAAELEAHPDGSAGTILFPPVPYGENENIYADRVTPPAFWERIELARWEATRAASPAEAEAGPLPSLIRRLREPGEESITPEVARARLTRLRSHWLGTDGNGRDILARLVIGSRVSLSVGFVAVAIYVTIGILLGSIAGYFRGLWDIVLGRVVEVVDCFPTLFLIIAAMAILPRPSIFNIMIIIGLTYWTGPMRLVRGEFLRLGGLDFVTAARALGLSPMRVVFRHMLPNALGPVLVAAAFGVAGAILIESALSFLGFGVPAPQASWGSVLHESRGAEKAMWWVTMFPGVLIFLTVTSYNLVGEGLRDALDPRLRR